MSVLKKLAGETIIYGSAYILPRIINYVVITSYLTYRYAEAEFGIFSELFSFVGLILAFATFQMETAYFRYLKVDSNAKKVFSTTSLTIFCLATSIVLAIFANRTSISVDVFKIEGLEQVIGCLAFIILLDAMEAIPFAKLRYDGKAKKFALFKLIKVITIAGLTLTFFEHNTFWASITPFSYFSSSTIPDRILMVVSANLVGSILSFGLVFKYYLDSWVMPDLKLWRKVLLYSTPLTLVAMAGVFNQYFGIYLVKIFSAAGLEGSAESGLYGAVLRVSILMSLFTTAFKFAAEPFFFKNMSSEEAPFLYARIANVFTFVGCLIMLGILMNIDLIQYLIGQNFRAGLSILPILLLAYLLLGIYTNFAIWYKIKDLTIYGTAISLVGSVVFVLICMQQIPLIGRAGAAYAQLACYGAMLTLCYFWGQRHFPVPYPVGKMTYKILTTLTIGWFAKQALIDAYFDSTLSRLLIGNALIILFIGLVLKAEPQLIGRLPMFKKKQL